MSSSSTSSTNVWALTNNFDNGGSRALWFNGHKWSAVKTFGSLDGGILTVSSNNVWLFGASALSARSICAFGGTSVSHWNGSGWKSTSVKGLLPKNNELCGSRLTGI